MAHSLSAKKRIRQNVKSRALNRWRKDRIKDALREFDSAIHDQNAELAAEKMKDAFKQIDQVAAKGTIHKNSAARRKSRLAKRLNAIQS